MLLSPRKNGQTSLFKEARAVKQIRTKIPSQNPDTFPNPEVRFRKEVEQSGGHSKQSTICSWLGALDTNKGARLSCSLVPFIASTAPSAWSSVSTVSEKHPKVEGKP